MDKNYTVFYAESNEDVVHLGCCISTTAVMFLLVLLLSLLRSPGIMAKKPSCEGDTLLHVL